MYSFVLITFYVMISLYGSFHASSTRALGSLGFLFPYCLLRHVSHFYAASSSVGSGVTTVNSVSRPLSREAQGVARACTCTSFTSHPSVFSYQVLTHVNKEIPFMLDTRTNYSTHRRHKEIPSATTSILHKEIPLNERKTPVSIPYKEIPWIETDPSIFTLHKEIPLSKYTDVALIQFEEIPRIKAPSKKPNKLANAKMEIPCVLVFIGYKCPIFITLRKFYVSKICDLPLNPYKEIPWITGSLRNIIKFSSDTMEIPYASVFIDVSKCLDNLKYKEIPFKLFYSLTRYNLYCHYRAALQNQAIPERRYCMNHMRNFILLVHYDLIVRHLIRALEFGFKNGKYK